MDKKKKNILIGGLLALVLLLAVGYAAFATNLNIEGTSNIDSRWDVHIKEGGVTVKSSNLATSTRNQKDSQLTASFACELTDPGKSTISYDIIVENTGTFRAKLSSINLTGTTDYIDATHTGIEVGDVIAADGGTDTLTVTVSYKNVTEVPTGEDATANITVTLNYVQDDGTSFGGGNEQASTLTKDSTYIPQYYEYHTTTHVTVGDTIDTSTWTQDPTTLNKDYYLGHDVSITSGTAGTVTANYVCFVIDNKQYCMKGKDSSGSVYFTENQGILSALKTSGKITCPEESWTETNAICSAGTLGYLYADNNDIVRAGISDSVRCHAGQRNRSVCS